MIYIYKNAFYMLIIDATEFNQNLLLTQAFCQSKNPQENMAAALRSFNPEYDGQPIFSYKFVTEWNFENSYITSWSRDPLLRSDKNLYHELFEKQLTFKREEVKESNENVDQEGRILVAEIDLTVVDGASEAISQGVIDGNDCPPIDTWFYLSKNKQGRVLFAWIPQQFVHLVNDAIEINCVECLRWYDAANF